MSFHLNINLRDGEFPERTRMVKMATALDGLFESRKHRPSIIRLAQRLGFTEIAELVRAFHRACALDERCERLVYWYPLSHDVLTLGKLDFDEPGNKNRASERSKKGPPYGPAVVEADAAKWAQAVRAIFPGGDAEIERSLAEELEAAANIEDAKIRKIRIKFVKAREAARDAYWEISQYLDKGAREAGAFVCSGCGCEVLETSS